jgi:hypothetical protein
MTESADRADVIGSAWRCMSFHAPPSFRKTLVVRSATEEAPVERGRCGRRRAGTILKGTVDHGVDQPFAPTITKRMPVARVMRRWSGSCGSTSPPMTRRCRKGRGRRPHALLPLISKPGRRKPATPITNAAAPRRTRRTSPTESSANPSIEMRASVRPITLTRHLAAFPRRRAGARDGTVHETAKVAWGTPPSPSSM